MKWLTNTTKSQVNQTFRELCKGHQGRRLVTGRPKAATTESTASLERLGLVGIYEVEAGTFAA